MKTSRVLCTVEALSAEFQRCCRDYDSLHIAVAWCGDPKHILPYKHLEDFKGKIVCTVGVSFNQTHPDAIAWLMRAHADVRIFRKQSGLFHPKVFLFATGDRYALFAGSSNLTYSGFYRNREVNALAEGSFSTQDSEDVRCLTKLLEEWRSEALSFRPNNPWLQQYRKAYQRDLAKQRASKISTEALNEEEKIGGANWLAVADWKTYYGELISGLERHDRKPQSLHHVLDAAVNSLSQPWKPSYFKDVKARRIVGGIGEYGAMGNVAAAGGFKGLLNSNGKQLDSMVATVNKIAKLQPPINWNELGRRLIKLVKLGHTMKVWGRVLALARPDLYCTVSSDPFRRNLAKLLSVPKSRFVKPEGYLDLIRFLHSTPWFNSPKPRDPKETAVWERRVAFMDGIFWAPE
jgi:HKD family nuclease